MDAIHLKNMVFYGYHGVKSEENSLGARFEVDITLRADLNAAIVSDRLSDTVNYNDVYNLVEHIVTERKYYLIEALAGEICERILQEFQNVEQSTVTVRKPNAPIKGVLDHVEVEIERSRK
ncbi:MAG: dihydroneopterin aldolase [Candidatus Marinimicrobia bacterium]|nr:dihydroneopterin aldolase [Candidatus Neomarinimicrobiota bacterium]MCF7829945.1 dihydroneopterin aldolase [Candidatus Neomarinimicrobiota bacterium]MCF7881901.1 dihydroneopterin aldolase [Candidatus Neomarinimicrobiota bacterium]